MKPTKMPRKSEVCPNHQFGCSTEIIKNSKQARDHANSCNYRQLKCLFPNCDKVTNFKDYLSHFSTHSKLTRNMTARNHFKFPILTKDQNPAEIGDPSIIKLQNGDHFFVLINPENAFLNCWICLFGSAKDAENYTASITVQSRTGCPSWRCFGPINCIEEIDPGDPGLSILVAKTWALNTAKKESQLDIEVKLFDRRIDGDEGFFLH